MDGKRRRTAAVVAAGVAIGMYGGVSPAAGSAATPKYVVVSQVGAGLGTVGAGIGIGAVVQAVQPARGKRAGLTISMHGLTPETTYLVGISRRPCSASADANEDGDVDGADYLLFRAVTAGAAEDDLLSTGRVPVRGSLRSARSVRITSGADAPGTEPLCAATLNPSTGALDCRPAG